MRDQFYPGILLGLMLSLSFPGTHSLAAEQPGPAAIGGFDSYIRQVESRLGRQHQSATSFLASLPSDDGTRSRLREGDLIIENLGMGEEVALPGALLHDWRGRAYVRGARVGEFVQLMKNYRSYPLYYAPEIERARSFRERHDHGDDSISTSMRVRQKHIITVVLDMDFDVFFSLLDPEHGYSITRSTQIREIDSPGTSRERVLSPKEEHGLLWRLNTYWTYEERDGGLYMEIETVSLTRSIPTGLGWVVRPLVASVPRDSLEFSLRSTCDVLRRGVTGAGSGAENRGDGSPAPSRTKD